MWQLENNLNNKKKMERVQFYKSDIDPSISCF